MLATPRPGQLGDERGKRARFGAIALGEAVTEVGQDTVVDAGIVQLQSQGVLEINAAAHRLGYLAVGQVEQELQHADRGQLSGRETGTPIARVPVKEVLVTPQPVAPALHPHRCRSARVARPRDPRSKTGLARRNGDEQTTDTSIAASALNRADHATDHAPRPWNQDHRQNQARSARATKRYPVFLTSPPHPWRCAVFRRVRPPRGTLPRR